MKGLEIDEIKKLGREAFEEAVGVWGQYADVDMATLEALAGKAKQVRRDLFEILFLKLINNSCIHKPIRIRQFGQVRVV